MWIPSRNVAEILVVLLALKFRLTGKKEVYIYIKTELCPSYEPMDGLTVEKKQVENHCSKLGSNVVIN